MEDLCISLMLLPSQIASHLVVKATKFYFYSLEERSPKPRYESLLLETWEKVFYSFFFASRGCLHSLVLIVTWTNIITISLHKVFLSVFQISLFSVLKTIIKTLMNADLSPKKSFFFRLSPFLFFFF